MHYESNLEIEEIKRYTRQIILKEIKPEGQIKIRNAKVLVVGLGGLGSPVAMYLAGSGIGTLGLLDYDILELHNLQRQTIHNESFIKHKKTESAANFIKSFNSSIKINTHDDFLDGGKIEKIIEEYDILLDCTDNIQTRYILNDAARIYKKKFIAASVLAWEGQVFIFSDQSPCYRCLFPEMKENVSNCDEVGVVSPVCGSIGTIQAIETLKLILGLSKPGLITFNTLAGEYNFFDLEKKNSCTVCTNKKFPEKTIPTSVPPKMERLDSKYRLSWDNYLSDKKSYTLIDTRNEILFEMCHIKDSINIPAEKIQSDSSLLKKYKNIALVCKRGISTKRLSNALRNEGIECLVVDGGLRKFKSDIDETFPLD